VTENWKDLAKLCQLKCGADGKVDRTRSVIPPPSRRVVRIPCPGVNCFATGNLKWICPTCQVPVCYGFIDDYLYCLCSRYHFVDAVFKCNSAIHGPRFVKYGDEDLCKRLKAFNPLEEYNILILGKSGVGKTMFINALVNYLAFESLHDAMADTGPLRYEIPFSFSYRDERMKDHEVVVGEESTGERFSMAGKSSTRRTLTYCFNIDGKLIRFTDTPGINDTAGHDQDHENAKDILKMLESIDKLSAILILLPPNETRLLSRLHRDTSKNILFGFTNASSTNFTLGATQGPLDYMLEELKTGIARGESNQYCFDSKGFMFLAAHKQKLPDMPGGKNHHARLWQESAGAVHHINYMQRTRRDRIGRRKRPRRLLSAYLPLISPTFCLVILSRHRCRVDSRDRELPCILRTQPVLSSWKLLVFGMMRSGHTPCGSSRRSEILRSKMSLVKHVTRH
jgi:hypothetical protein